MNKNIVYGSITIAIVIAIGAYFFPTQVQRLQQAVGAGTRFINGLSTTSTAPSSGQVLTTTLTVNSATTLIATSTLGSTYTQNATSTISYGYETRGGVKYANTRVALDQNTNVPCNLVNPLKATSTLALFQFVNNTSTSTAAVIRIATTSTAFATTSAGILTNFAAETVAANTSRTISFRPYGRDTAVIGPDESIVVWAEGTNGAGNKFSLVGSCSAEFVQP